MQMQIFPIQIFPDKHIYILHRSQDNEDNEIFAPQIFTCPL